MSVEEGEESSENRGLDGLNASYVRWYFKSLRLLHHDAVTDFKSQYTSHIRNFLQDATGTETYFSDDFGEYTVWTSPVDREFVIPIRSQLQHLYESLARYEMSELDTGVTESVVPPREATVTRSNKVAKPPAIFVGHGHGDLYLRVVTYLTRRLNLEVDYFEDEVRAGYTNLEVVQNMLNKASFAVVVATADDATDEGKIRARQNVVHEIGLFQGKLGFRKVAVLRQNGTEEFSNLAGYQELRFDKNDINSKFEDLRQMLVREGVLQTT